MNNPLNLIISFYNRGKNKAWSEEDEEELRQLFMKNQESPESDQDVIDWIVENLKDRSRTRRGVIKKLKELGLIFKAPTKKSNKEAQSKNLFMPEEDKKLEELYDEHRFDKHCLAKIMEVFKGKRSKKAIVNRMIQLHIIAEESDILPAKKTRNKILEEGDSERHLENAEKSDNDTDNDESDDDGISTQQLKNRLAELESSSESSDDDVTSTELAQSTKQRKIINRHILDSSDDENDNNGTADADAIDADDIEMTKQIIKPNEIKETRKSQKRERSQSPDENEMNASNNNISNNNQMKRIRRIIDSDDDE